MTKVSIARRTAARASETYLRHRGLAYWHIAIPRSYWVAFGVKRTSTRGGPRPDFMRTRPANCWVNLSVWAAFHAPARRSARSTPARVGRCYSGCVDATRVDSALQSHNCVSLPMVVGSTPKVRAMAASKRQVANALEQQQCQDDKSRDRPADRLRDAHEPPTHDSPPTR